MTGDGHQLSTHLTLGCTPLRGSAGSPPCTRQPTPWLRLLPGNHQCQSHCSGKTQREGGSHPEVTQHKHNTYPLQIACCDLGQGTCYACPITRRETHANRCLGTHPDSDSENLEMYARQAWGRVRPDRDRRNTTSGSIESAPMESSLPRHLQVHNSHRGYDARVCSLSLSLLPCKGGRE